MPTVPFVLALFLSAINFFSEVMSEKIQRHHSKLLSLSSGIFIAYIFMAFLPEALKGQEVLGENVFLLMLFGFAFFHGLEKYLYQHVKNKNTLMEDLAIVHKAGFALDHFLVGMILFFAVNVEDFFIGLLIVIPLCLHVITSSITLNHIHVHSKKNIFVILGLSAMPVLGTLFAFFLEKSAPWLYHVFFSVTIGTLLYVSIRDMMPQEDGGKISYFVLGVILAILAVIFAKTAMATGLMGLAGF